jgi:hypothetical protein
MYFVDFCFHLSNVGHNISVCFEMIQNFDISELAIAKVKKSI